MKFTISGLRKLPVACRFQHFRKWSFWNGKVAKNWKCVIFMKMDTPNHEKRGTRMKKSRLSKKLIFWKFLKFFKFQKSHSEIIDIPYGKVCFPQCDFWNFKIYENFLKFSSLWPKREIALFSYAKCMTFSPKTWKVVPSTMNSCFYAPNRKSTYLHACKAFLGSF